MKMIKMIEMIKMIKMIFPTPFSFNVILFWAKFANRNNKNDKMIETKMIK